MRHFHTFENSLFGGPSEPATLSFEVHWSGRAPPQHIHNVAGQVSGEFVQDTAHGVVGERWRFPLRLETGVHIVERLCRADTREKRHVLSLTRRTTR